MTACGVARKLIRQAYSLLGSEHPVGDAMPIGNGGVLIVWKREPRQVWLTVPPVALQAPDVYHAELIDGKLYSGMERPANGERLAHWLRWLGNEAC